MNASVDSLGIEIIDVRLRRADYPESTSQNIFNRMKSEREREAKEFRATGDEEAQKIRADAEKTRTVIVAEAKREAQEVRGQGDSNAIRIYADSFGQDPEFFSFYRSMEVTLGDLELTIDADPMKTDKTGNRTNLFEKYGEGIIGLADESKEKLREEVLERCYEQVRKLLREH